MGPYEAQDAREARALGAESNITGLRPAEILEVLVGRREQVESLRQQLEGAVSSTVAQVEALMGEMTANDVGAYGKGYHEALEQLRTQLRLRFGGR